MKKVYEINFTSTEIFKFNTILDKTERKHLMSVYRFIKKNINLKIKVFNDCSLKISLMALRKAYNQECFSKYRCKQYTFNSLIKQLEDLNVLEVIKNGKFGANTYKVIEEEITEDVNIKCENQIAENSSNVALEETLDCNNMDNSKPSLLYYTHHFDTKNEIEEIAITLLENYKVVKQDKKNIIERIKVKIDKYWKNINKAGAKEYLTKMIIESIYYVKSLRNNIKKQVQKTTIATSTVKKNNKVLHFNNYEQRSYDYDKLADAVLGWD